MGFMDFGPWSIVGLDHFAMKLSEFFSRLCRDVRVDGVGSSSRALFEGRCDLRDHPWS